MMAAANCGLRIPRLRRAPPAAARRSTRFLVRHGPELDAIYQGALHAHPSGRGGLMLQVTSAPSGEETQLQGGLNDKCPSSLSEVDWTLHTVTSPSGEVVNLSTQPDLQLRVFT